MISLGYSIKDTDRATLQKACDARKVFLEERREELCSSTNPATLWNGIVKYRYRSPGSDAGGGSDMVESYEDIRITYEGFRNMVYELLFDASPADEDTITRKERDHRRKVYFSHPFLSPATFLAFARSDMDTVPAVPLYAFAAKRLLLFRLRVELELVASAPPPVFRDRSASPPSSLLRCPPSSSSPLSNGLTQEDVESFVSSLIPNLRLVRDIPPWMHPYYLCHASRKFFFMCDNRHSGALSIEAIMKSDVFSELLRMFESDTRDAVLPYPVKCPVEIPAHLCSTDAHMDDTVPAVVISYENDGSDLNDLYKVQLVADDDVCLELPRSQIYYSSSSMEYLPPEALNMDNWFSLPLMCRVYDHFTSLDVDEDGVLTEEELSHYSDNSFTRLAINRAFECHVPQTGSRHIMDYKTYLNFVIATEHAATRPAMKYIWEMLDLDSTKTHIKVSTLHCFCKELAGELVGNGLMAEISARSILSEIVDMVNPAWHEWVTFEDIERSGHQATVLPILLSYKNFFAYDCREQTAATASDEYTESKDQ